jgi:hypothetical protein
MRYVLILILFLAIPFIPKAEAECKLRARTTYSSYYTPPTYYYKYGATYKEYEGTPDYCDEPLYYYKDGYYYPYKEKKKVVVVPKAIEVETYRNHYYSIDPYMQQNLLADAIVGRLIRMQGEKANLTVVPNPGTPTPLPNPTPLPLPNPALNDDKPGTFQDAALLTVVKNSCVKCHGTGSKYTKFITADEKLPDLPAGKVWEAFGLVNSGEMPKGGKSLDDDSVKKFYEWAKKARR